MLETSLLSRGIPQRMPEVLTPEIRIVESDDSYGKFVIEPLERGYGITIGNPIRRMLLSSVAGTAITWVKVDGVLHEYSTIPHMKEEVMEFLISVKGVRIRSVTGRPGKMRLEITGEGRVCAGDIATSADFEIVNPELHLATLDSEEANLSVEFNVEEGKGYQPVSQSDGLAGPVTGVLPVDAIFNPVKKVNFTVERTRVGQVTDYQRLVLEVWTDGTITPVEALKKSSQALVTHFFLFNSLGQEAKGGSDRQLIAVSPDVYQTPIDRLVLSPRTLNCLKRAHITKVGQVLEMSNEEILKIRNFGTKSLEELLNRLREEDMLSEEEWARRTGASVEPKIGQDAKDEDQQEEEDQGEVVEDEGEDQQGEEDQGQVVEDEGEDQMSAELEVPPTESALESSSSDQDQEQKDD